MTELQLSKLLDLVKMAEYQARALGGDYRFWRDLYTVVNNIEPKLEPLKLATYE